MQVIKDKKLIENDWTFIADDGAIVDAPANISVSLSYWQSHKQQLLDRGGQIGIRLAPTDDTDQLSGELTGVTLIELDFPGFGDGRLFSQAHLLRNKLGFQGEIRAVGHYLPDQIYFLSRVGVNAFELADAAQIPLALSCLDDFSVNYQAAVY